MTVQIEMEDYIDMIENRWNEVVDLWGNDASIGLHDELIELLEECPPPPENASPNYIIDNYFVNGDFYSKEDMIEDEWLIDKGEIEERWQELCEDAIISNDKYLCKQF